MGLMNKVNSSEGVFARSTPTTRKKLSFSDILSLSHALNTRNRTSSNTTGSDLYDYRLLVSHEQSIE